MEGTPSERPSFAQAFASEPAAESLPATTSSETTPSETPAVATAPPDQATSADTTPAPAGEPPKERWESILQNARTKTRAEVEAEYQQKFGWAEGLDRNNIAAYHEIGRLYREDRPTFVRQILAEAQNDPQLLTQLRSEAARFLGTRAPQVQAIEPDIPVVDAQGNVVSQSFSAEKVKALLAQERENLKRELLGEIQPIKETFAQRQQAEAKAKADAELKASVASLYEQATAELPQFKEHEAEIAAALDTIPGDPGTALYRAWAKVVLPKLEASSKAKALDDMKTKAAASVVNPASAVVATTQRPKSLTDPALQWQ